VFSLPKTKKPAVIYYIKIIIFMSGLKFKLTGFFLIILVLLVGIILFAFDIVKVDSREVAVVTNRGEISQVLGAGWHPKTPLLTRHAATYDISTINNTVIVDAASKDQQAIEITTNIQYQLQADRIEEIFLKIGGSGNGGAFADSRIDAIIDPILNESTKSASAQFSASEILSNRDGLKAKIIENLQSRLDEYFVNVLTVNIANVEFSEQFNQAIEDKVTAQQRAEQARFEQEQATIELETERIRSEALQVRGQALSRNPQILEEKKIEKWDGKLPQVQGQDGIIIDLNN
jgi:prohibitin 2